MIKKKVLKQLDGRYKMLEQYVREINKKKESKPEAKTKATTTRV